MTAYMNAEVNFGNHIVIDSEDERFSSASITPSSIEDISLPYHAQPSETFLVPSAQQITNLMEDYFYPPTCYYPNRNIYGSSDCRPKYIANNDQFICTSPSSNDSYMSVNLYSNRPFTNSINHGLYLSEKTPSYSQDEFGSYSFTNFDYKSSSSSRDSANNDRNDHCKEYVSTGRHIRDKRSALVQHENSVGKKSGLFKRSERIKDKKRCSNCQTTQSPSWRRSISPHSLNELLCNACGLYEKTTKSKRMLVTQDDGATKVVRKRDVRGYCCSRCGVKDATRWRRHNGNIQCDKCVRTKKQ